MKNNNAAPKNIIGNEKCEMLNPIMNDVIVVPIFAPIIIPIACLKVNNPALTNPIVITVVPELDCISTVTNIPTKTPKNGEVVYLSKIYFNLSPAANCNPSPIYFIQNKNIPSPPKKLKIICCQLSVFNDVAAPIFSLLSIFLL